MPVDPHTGQVYSETIVKVQHGLKNGTRTSNGHLLPGKNVEGPTSLSDLALRCVLRHLDALTPETLTDLPILVLERLWEAIRHA